MLVILFLLTLFRQPTITGIQKCDPIDHTLFALLISLGMMLTFVGIFVVKKEYTYKKSIGYQFTPGDFECTTFNSIKLPLIGLFGGIATASLGIGAGTIFSPIIIQMGVQPQVASATGMFMVMVLTTASTMVMIILK